MGIVSDRPYSGKGLTIRSIENLFKRKFSEATRVGLLWKGRESFEALFDAIREAQRCVCLQFYIFRNDETGTALGELLKEKARAGVRVYILYDHFGSLGTPRRFWKELREAGVQIRASRPFKWNAPLTYVHRDHRKLIVIDAYRAFTGGLNVANEYSGFHLRRSGKAWRDTGILIEGPVVKDLFDNFRQSWYAWGGGRIETPESTRAIPEQNPSLEKIPALPIFAYSVRSRRRMRRLLAYSIESAQKSICLTTAYFIPSRRMIRLFENAKRRGVQVKLLVPGRSDIPAACFAGRAFFSRLLDAGVEIFTYDGEMLHAKTYLFDQVWSIIGSTNLDYQSLWYNDEGNVGIFDEGVGVRMAEIFEEDLRHAKPIQKETWKKRPFLEKLKEHFFALFRKRL